MAENPSLWHNEDRTAWFLLPEDAKPPGGELLIIDLTGRSVQVDRNWMTPYEVSEDQGRRWAKDHLGATLEELKKSLDTTLGEWRAKLEEFKRTPGPAECSINVHALGPLLELFSALPSIVGRSVSGNQADVTAAREKLAELQRKLSEGGVSLDDRFTGFADRLASLRKEAEERKTAPGEDPS
jgi:hypothetical protein